ncbi:MAG: lytic transglycosylase domain-containing protein, partial [Burkholderia gladioli]
NLLKQGPAAVLAQVEAVQKLSAISAEDARKADDLRKKWLGLERTFESTGIRVVESLMPAFDMLIGYLKQLADWIASHQHDITEWINEAIGTVKEFSKDANKAAEAVGGWKNVLIVLAAIKILSTVSPLFQLASALASVGSALGVIGTLGPAAIAALAGLYVAKKMGLPDVDEKQGKLDLENDDWLAASGHLSAGDFIAAGWDEVKKAVSAVKNNSYRGSHQDEKYLSGLEEKYRLPAGLLDSVWQTESGRGKNMLSSSGAKGHFQFMDATAKQYGLKDPNDFKESAEAAARYYRDLLKQNKGDLPKALAAYNWGQGNVNRYGLEKAPAETRGYIGKVMAGMAQDAGIPNAAQANALSIAGMAPKASMPPNPPPGSSSTSSSEVNINGPITVTTQATDAQGVARGLGSAINQYHFVTQANNGLS